MSTDPKLANLRAKGGKLIVYHGNSDAVFSVNDTARWFARLQANLGGDIAGFARFYPVPGMAHCSGGPATDQFDALGALVDWVEKGSAPAALLAAVNPENKELPAGWGTTRTRAAVPLAAGGALRRRRPRIRRELPLFDTLTTRSAARCHSTNPTSTCPARRSSTPSSRARATT